MLMKWNWQKRVLQYNVHLRHNKIHIHSVELSFSKGFSKVYYQLLEAIPEEKQRVFKQKVELNNLGGAATWKCIYHWINKEYKKLIQKPRTPNLFFLSTDEVMEQVKSWNV